MSTFPVITAGEALTSALLASMLTQVGYKSADQSVTSSTTVVNDTALVVPVAANAKYKVEFLIYYTGGTANSSDFKYGITVPSGAVMSPIRELGLNTSLAVQYLTVATGGAFGSNGAGNQICAELAFTLSTSATAGNLQLQWAQNTSSATATTVKTGSILTALRVA